MNASLKKLYAEATELAEADRAALAGMLLESLEPVEIAGVDEAWAQEIQRRIREVDSGEVSPFPWSEVRSRLRARLNAD